MEILILVFLVIGAALLCGNGPAEPPIYRIQVVPPEPPAGGRGHLIIAVVLMVFILLMLAAG
jgi:hypothetical protein